LVKGEPTDLSIRHVLELHEKILQLQYEWGMASL